MLIEIGKIKTKEISALEISLVVERAEKVTIWPLNERSWGYWMRRRIKSGMTPWKDGNKKTQSGYWVANSRALPIGTTLSLDSGGMKHT